LAHRRLNKLDTYLLCEITVREAPVLIRIIEDLSNRRATENRLQYRR
jgi:hypothetical protein